MDFRNKSNIRGLRNNNPGNLEKSKSPWQGKVPHSQNTDGRFEQFESIEMGLRALMINARTLINRGKNTIEKLIYTWAPPSKNNSKNYADYVAKQMGIAKDKVFEKLDKDFFIRLAKAITAVENGENSLKQIPNSAFEKAHSLMGITQYISEKKRNSNDISFCSTH